MLSEKKCVLLKSRVFGPVIRYQRLSGLTHPLHRRLFQPRNVLTGQAQSPAVGFEKIPVGCARLVVEPNYLEVIKRSNVPESRGKSVRRGTAIVARSNGVGDAKQSDIALWFYPWR